MSMESLCDVCSAIPLEIFQRYRPGGERPSIKASAILALFTGNDDIYESSKQSNIHAAESDRDYCYQHHHDLELLATNPDVKSKKCQLCAVLLSSIKAARQQLPGRAFRNPGPPERSPNCTGVTLHSFDNCHFIVMDGTHWSLVRFIQGNHVNDKGLLLQDRADSRGVFRVVNRWISECVRFHSSCTMHRLNSYPGYIPARVIRVKSGPDHPILILCDRSDAQQDGAEYIALSHCWGNDPKAVPRTTIANLAAMKRNIPWDSLSKTFKDAVETTLKLRKSYIWIDSLCIVQDDITDLDVHCESMSQIYSNSYCTISATGAKDGSEGCFLPRTKSKPRPVVVRPIQAQSMVHDSTPIKRFSIGPPRSMHDSDASKVENVAKAHNVSNSPMRRDQRESKAVEERTEEIDAAQNIVFTVYPSFREWTHSMKGPLLSRGWTLQERELSVRVLHYTSDRVVFECRQCYGTEDDSRLKEKHMLFDAGLKFRLLDGNIRDRKSRPWNYKFSKWTELVEEYSMRSLSVKSDKLRAIAGLADAIRTIQQDDLYLSGLWKRDLPTELLWQSIPDPRQALDVEIWPPAPIAQGLPTWTWAAHDGAVKFASEQKGVTREFVCQIQSYSPTQISLCGLILKHTICSNECQVLDNPESGTIHIWPRDSEASVFHIFLDTSPKPPWKHDLHFMAVVECNPRPGQTSSGSELPSYSESVASKFEKKDVQHSEQSQMWNNTPSTIGLVLLRQDADDQPRLDSTVVTIPESNPLSASIYRRVGMFRMVGHLPKGFGKVVNIV